MRLSMCWHWAAMIYETCHCRCARPTSSGCFAVALTAYSSIRSRLAKLAQTSFMPHAAWAWRGSSQSGAAVGIAAADRRTGSRSETGTAQPCFWTRLLVALGLPITAARRRAMGRLRPYQMIVAKKAEPAMMSVTPARSIAVSNHPVISQSLRMARLNCWTVSDQHWHQKLMND